MHAARRTGLCCCIAQEILPGRAPQKNETRVSFRAYHSNSFEAQSSNTMPSPKKRPLDAEAEATNNPLGTDDYATMFTSVHDFLTDDTRGLEQFYFIVQHRPLQ